MYYYRGGRGGEGGVEECPEELQVGPRHAPALVCHLICCCVWVFLWVYFVLGGGVFICIYKYVCVSVCLFVCMQVCVLWAWDVWVLLLLCFVCVIGSDVYIHSHTYIYIHTHTYIYIHTLALIHIYIYTDIFTLMVTSSSPMAVTTFTGGSGSSWGRASACDMRVRKYACVYVYKYICVMRMCMCVCLLFFK